MKKNIVILGGGTAGWLTALLVRVFYPSYEISLVESDEIGILGAGEGTTPHFVKILEFLGIDLPSVIKECKATLKLGIHFKNWHGNDDSYFHGFESSTPLNPVKNGDLFPFAMLVKRIAKGQHLDDIFFGKLLAKFKKVPFSLETLNKNSSNSKTVLKKHASHALHFDARLLASFLRKKAESRGIRRIEGIVTSFISDDDGNIKSLELKDGSTINLDFIFDCSGFQRLITGKHFGEEWVSYKDFLPLDTALPFFLPHDNDVAPETEAIAMKYGWVWKIPVEGRYGCGYVFDSSYIDEVKAKEELEEFFGQKIESPKTFKFEAGSFRDIFIKNSFAVGLAQGFIEPLEATSIWINNINIFEFLKMDGINTKSESKRKKINENAYKRNESVANFIYSHYITPRQDTDFWKDFKSKNKVPQSLKESLEVFYESPFSSVDPSLLWGNDSFLTIGSGLNQINREDFAAVVDRFGLKYDDAFKKLMAKQSEISKQCLTHKQYLEVMKSL